MTQQVKEFLSHVWGQDGEYCTATITTGGDVRHYYHDSIDKAAEQVDKYQNRHVYFNTSALRTGARQRNGATASTMRTLVLDLDCGEEKGFKTQNEALLGLMSFISKTGLPKPTIVNSGWGIHAYWMFDDAVAINEWYPLATQLKDGCRRHELPIDPTPTADAARLMRMPGSFNVKHGGQKSVKVLKMGKAHPYSFFRDLFDKHGWLAEKPKEEVGRRKPMSAVTAALMGNTTSKFSNLAKKSAKGTGCNFIKHVLVNQAELPEPEWRAGLSIAYTCVDGDTAIHKMSKGDPRYDPAETVEKASLTAGPYTCETIRGLGGGHCDDCPHQITSPIQLANEVVKMLPQQNEDGETQGIVFEIEKEGGEVTHPKDHTRNKAPKEEIETTEGIVDNATHSVKEKFSVKVPPPAPYFIGKNGGIYKEEKIDGETIQVLVYNHTLVVDERVKDPEDGDCIVFKLVLPRDGVRTFRVSNADIHSDKDFKRVLASNGVAAAKKQMGEVVEYSIRYVKELIQQHAAKNACLQYGWTEQKDSFIVGPRAYGVDSWEANPVSSSTGDTIESLQPKGDLDVWTDIANTFSYDGLEAQQLGVLSGFASPLVAFCGAGAAVLNLQSALSGSGKTTSAKVGLSVWGDPEVMASTFQDTNNAFVFKLGVYNHLPVMLDEISNYKDYQLSNLLYAFTQYKGKDRMASSSNRLRVNFTRWRNMMVTTSNTSVINALASLKGRPDGELHRLVELQANRIFVEGAEELHEQLPTNYGVAGEVYAAWLVKNVGRIPTMMDKIKKRLYKAIGRRQEERFIVTTFACCLLACKIANELGLIDYDYDRLFKYVTEQTTRTREDNTDNVVKEDSFISEFLLENANGIVCVAAKDEKYYAIKEPTSNKVVARFDLTTGLLLIVKKALQEYCVDRGFPIRELLEDAAKDNESYKFTGQAKARMLAHTRAGLSAPVNSLKFQCSTSETRFLLGGVLEVDQDASEVGA